MYGHILVSPGVAKNASIVYSIEKFRAFQMLAASKIALCIRHLDGMGRVAMSEKSASIHHSLYTFSAD
jgi:hypothetical protein